MVLPAPATSADRVTRQHPDSRRRPAVTQGQVRGVLPEIFASTLIGGMILLADESGPPLEIHNPVRAGTTRAARSQTEIGHYADYANLKRQHESNR